MLAIGDSEGSVQLWDVASTKCMRTMTGHTDRQASPIRLKFGYLTQKAAKFCNLYAHHDRPHRQAGVANSPKIRLSYSKCGKIL